GALVLWPLAALAQAPANPPGPGASDSPSRWSASFIVGGGAAKGDFSSLLQTPVSGEMNMVRTTGAWRLGAGLSFGSFTMRSPYTNGLEWGLQQIYGSATRVLRTQGRVLPYVQVRGGVARLHPRSHPVDQRPLPDDFKLGKSATEAANGFSVGFVPGVEWAINGKVALDLSAAFG